MRLAEARITLNDRYPKEPETQTYLDQLHALSSLGGPSR